MGAHDASSPSKPVDTPASPRLVTKSTAEGGAATGKGVPLGPMEVGRNSQAVVVDQAGLVDIAVLSTADSTETPAEKNLMERVTSEQKQEMLVLIADSRRSPDGTSPSAVATLISGDGLGGAGAAGAVGAVGAAAAIVEDEAAGTARAVVAAGAARPAGAFMPNHEPEAVRVTAEAERDICYVRIPQITGQFNFNLNSYPHVENSIRTKLVPTVWEEIRSGGLRSWVLPGIPRFTGDKIGDLILFHNGATTLHVYEVVAMVYFRKLLHAWDSPAGRNYLENAMPETGKAIDLYATGSPASVDDSLFKRDCIHSIFTTS